MATRWEVLHVDGRREPLKMARPKGPEISELQAAIGGYVELVKLGGRRELWVNEDGRRLELADNPQASMAAGRRIVGPAVLKTWGKPRRMKAERWTVTLWQDAAGFRWELGRRVSSGSARPHGWAGVLIGEGEGLADSAAALAHAIGALSRQQFSKRTGGQ